MKTFITRGEARAAREAKEKAEQGQSTQDPTLDSLKTALIGMQLANLEFEKIVFHHTDENGNIVKYCEFSAIK